MKSTEAKVGAFVLLSVVVLSVTIYFITKSEFGGKQVPYLMYLRYAGGFEPGTAVLFGGISVGKVTAVQPDPADPTRIQISLAVKEGTPINAKSVGKLGSVNLLGSHVVSITTGSLDASRLPPGAVIPSQETISIDELQRKVAALADTAQTTLTSLNTDINNVSADARRVLANVNDLTGRPNQERVAAILSNADHTVAQLSSKAGPTLDNVNLTVSNANRTITGLERPIQTDLAELQRTLEAAHSLTNSLQAVVSDNRENIDYSLDNVRMVTDNLNDFTRSVKEQPWSLVRIKQAEDRKVPQGKTK
jgi:phospholipid/cholesterol/gamma-HCH transport system substrate-binding protein